MLSAAEGTLLPCIGTYGIALYIGGIQGFGKRTAVFNSIFDYFSNLLIASDDFNANW